MEGTELAEAIGARRRELQDSLANDICIDILAEIQSKLYPIALWHVEKIWDLLEGTE